MAVVATFTCFGIAFFFKHCWLNQMFLLAHANLLYIRGACPSAEEFSKIFTFSPAILRSNFQYFPKTYNEVQFN